MQENNPREMELNFSSSDERVAEMQEARNELFDELTAETAAEDNAADFPEDNAAVIPEENTPVAAAVVADSPVLRSRHPVNRPAGTPPLPQDMVNETASAAEKAIAGKSYGVALRILREMHNVSYKDLDQITKIQPCFLEALENENLDQLPPLVYVIAYVRSLCRYYKLSSAASDTLVATLKEKLEYTCTDDIINTLDIDRRGEEVNERKMKKILWGFASLLLLLVLGVALTLFLIFRTPESEGSETEGAENTAVEQGKKFDPNTIYQLLEPPTLDLPKLPVAE